MTTSRNPPLSNDTVRKLKADKAVRRKREIALLALSVAIALTALILLEPFLILISVFPALASYGQR